MLRAVVLVLSVLLGAVCLLAATACERASDLAPTIELPIRTEGARPHAPTVPELPWAADSLVPLTFRVRTTITVRGRPPIETLQLVTRATDRVRLVVDHGRKEWIFHRNPVDRRRASGWLVDHVAREILAYDETSLQTDQHLRGWADVLMMRFDAAALTRLRATGAHRRVADMDFAQYRSRDHEAAGFVEVWWSETALLPLHVASRDASATMTSVVEAVARARDLSPADDPRLRYRDYAALDLVDARDRRH
jgi:hypothetical protein